MLNIYLNKQNLIKQIKMLFTVVSSINKTSGLTGRFLVIPKVQLLEANFTNDVINMGRGGN